jgi:hypothetical protein
MSSTEDACQFLKVQFDEFAGEADRIQRSLAAIRARGEGRWESPEVRDNIQSLANSTSEVVIDLSLRLRRLERVMREVSRVRKSSG